jgi:hypothetical protein
MITFVTIVFCAIFIISAYRIAVVHSLSRVTRGALLALRLCLFALIVIVFIEPVFVFEQLSTPLRPVPVLVDVSKSMRLFTTDSIVLQSISSLEQWNLRHAGEKQKFVFYCFGDSLRPFADISLLSFSDCRSFLPESLKDKILRQAAAMILISDGNWSNATLPSENYTDKNMMYLPLRSAQNYPYLQVELRYFPSALPVDSPLVAVIALEGVSKQQDVIAVSVVEKNRSLLLRTIPVPAGFFKQEVTFHIKNPAAGRHLYRFDARSRADTLFCSRYALCSALPDRFNYALCNAQPTLDRRFIQLALQRHPDFIESSTDKKQDLDLLVIFDWDEKARDGLNRLKPEGAVLFIGSLPCTGDPMTVTSTAASGLFRPPSDASVNPFDDFDFRKLPPPSRYYSCNDLSSHTRNVLLSAVLPRTGRRAADTLNVVFTGRYQHNNYIVCAAADVWRWDFWPIAVESEEGRVFGFSEPLVALTKEVLINGLSEELLLYPAVPPSEPDSLAFLTIFPADLPVPSEVQLACKFSSAGGRHYDTDFVMTATGSPHQIIRFRPLTAGHYRLEVSAVVSTAADNRRCFFSDSVYIGQDRSEYSTNGQNTSLLQELAQPFADFSESSLHAVFFNSRSEMKLPIKETIRFSRNWPLLLLLLFVLAAEWILRRRVKLD